MDDASTDRTITYISEDPSDESQGTSPRGTLRSNYKDWPKLERMIACDLIEDGVISEQMIKSLHLCMCPASDSNVCFVATKTDLTRALILQGLSTAGLRVKSESITDAFGHPLVVLLKEVGAALFLPGLDPTRILPPRNRFSRSNRARDRASLKAAIDAMSRVPRPNETFQPFLRRALSDACL